MKFLMKNACKRILKLWPGISFLEFDIPCTLLSTVRVHSLVVWIKIRYVLYFPLFADRHTGKRMEKAKSYMRDSLITKCAVEWYRKDRSSAKTHVMCSEISVDTRVQLPMRSETSVTEDVQVHIFVTTRNNVIFPIKTSDEMNVISKNIW